jgi:hypothetical protein
LKKIFIFFMVLCAAAGFAAAEDEGTGLSAGLEFGVLNVSKANDGDMSLYLMPILIYDNSFLDGALDLYAELDYTIGLSKVPDNDGNEVNPQSLYVDLSVGYNLGLGENSTLSFILENEFDEITISPKVEGGNSLTGIFTPAVKFNQSLSIGDIYAQIGAPITYIREYKEADMLIGLDCTLGWKSDFGLGIEAKICSLLSPSEVTGYTGLDLTVSYEAERVYFEVEALIPKETDEGITITPEFDYSFKNFTFYIKSVFEGIGTSGDVIISPAFGVKYSF